MDDTKEIEDRTGKRGAASIEEKEERQTGKGKGEKGRGD